MPLFSALQLVKKRSSDKYGNQLILSAPIDIAVAVPEIGTPSQPWISRQLGYMPSMNARLLHWRRGSFANELENQFECSQFNGTVRPVNRHDVGRWANRLMNFNSGNYLAADRTSTQGVIDLIGDYRPELILCHFGHTALYFLPVAKRLGIPVVAHFHGFDISFSVDRNRWYRWSLKNCVNAFAACIVVGSHQRDKLLELGADRDRIHLIPCGVPTELFSPIERATGTPFRFVIAARLVRDKGVDVSLRAFAKLLQSNPDIELAILGGGPEEGSLKLLAAELDVADKVTFHGFVEQAKVTQIMKGCHALLQHSVEDFDWVEGFGVAVAEAAASGLPVIVSKSGGLVDQVVDGRTGFIVPLRDEDAMARAMGKLCDDPEFARCMGQNGRKHVVEHFDSRKLSLKLQQVLQQAIFANGRARDPELNTLPTNEAP